MGKGNLIQMMSVRMTAAIMTATRMTVTPSLIRIPTVIETIKKETISDSGASFQVKSVQLLKSSLRACLGPGATVVKPEMILSGAAFSVDTTTGLKPFLLGASKVGQDIVDLEQVNLYDPEKVVRGTVGADALSDLYLRSLGTIADVAAFNCDLNDPMCNCSTDALAKSFLERCLPAFKLDTAEGKTAFDAFSTACKGNSESKRKAIASVIGSYAFASAR
jgi:hypothetical protein